MDFTSYAQSVSEITQNFQVGTQLGLPTPANVVKTGGYSGLGVYNPNPNDQTGPPTDYGLTASNPALIQAARDNNMQYLHGNMSFGSHAAAVAGCFNCGFWLGLSSDNSHLTVSGDGAAGSTTYGSEKSAKITLTANTPVAFTPSLLP